LAQRSRISRPPNASVRIPKASPLRSRRKAAKIAKYSRLPLRIFFPISAVKLFCLELPGEIRLAEEMNILWCLSLPRDPPQDQTGRDASGQNLGGKMNRREWLQTTGGRDWRSQVSDLFPSGLGLRRLAVGKSASSGGSFGTRGQRRCRRASFATRSRFVSRAMV